MKKRIIAYVLIGIALAILLNKAITNIGRAHEELAADIIRASFYEAKLQAIQEEKQVLQPGETAVVVDPNNPVMLKDSEGNDAVLVKEFKVTALPSTPETTGKASYYDYSLPGSPNYSKENDTCAARDWPRGTKILVRYQDKTVVCRVNDYGPSKAVHPDRILDLSSHAFKQLAPLSRGVITVTAQPLD